jgi:hypothetical protein
VKFDGRNTVNLTARPPVDKPIKAINVTAKIETNCLKK